MLLSLYLKRKQNKTKKIFIKNGDKAPVSIVLNVISLVKKNQLFSDPSGHEAENCELSSSFVLSSVVGT